MTEMNRNADDDGIRHARERLRTLQRGAASAILPNDRLSAIEARGDEVHRQTIERLEARERGAQIVDATMTLPDSLFTFDAQREHRRLRRAREIVDRVVPGPFESATFFDMLTRHAAALELSVEDDAANSTDPAGSRTTVLIGTRLAGTSRSVPFVERDANFALVLLDPAFLNLGYQVAKLTVRSWQPMRVGDSGEIAFDSRRSVVDARLDARPELPDALSKLLDDYTAHGRVSGTGITSAPQEQRALQGIVTAADRFVVARGYSDAAPHDSDADFSAASLALSSTLAFDPLDPREALLGCHHAIVCDDLVVQAATRRGRNVTGQRAIVDRLDSVCKAYAGLMARNGVSDERARQDCEDAFESASAAINLWQRATASRGGSAAAG